MRLALFFAALAALWVQPAKAAVFVVGGGVGTTTETVGCIIGGTEPACSQPPTVTRLIYSFALLVSDEWVTQEGGVLFNQTVAGIGDCRGYRYCGFSVTPWGDFRITLANGPGMVARSFELIGTAAQITPASFPGGTGILSSITAVPEPATWALMLLGFGAVGGAMRRGRGGAAFAPRALAA